MLEPLLTQLNAMRVILASSSKQRAELLRCTVRDGATEIKLRAITYIL